MPTLPVDTLVFNFLATVAAQKYDTWQHYTLVWSAGGSRKAMDIVAVQSPPAPGKPTTWLIEAKDFRVITNPPKPSNIGGLAQTVAGKVTDTLAGLHDAAKRATLPVERNHAAIAISATTVRVSLHLEPHTGPHTALFPKAFAASVLQKLRQLVKTVDPMPLVLNIADTPTAGVPWTVA